MSSCAKPGPCGSLSLSAACRSGSCFPPWVLGVLLASAIMAGTVVYFDALRELALRRTLDKLTTSEVSILAKVERGPTNQVEYDLVDGLTTGQFDLQIDWLLRDRIRAGKTATFFLTPPGNEEFAGDDNARTYFAFVPRLSERTTILGVGKPPNEAGLERTRRAAADRGPHTAGSVPALRRRSG